LTSNDIPQYRKLSTVWNCIVIQIVVYLLTYFSTIGVENSNVIKLLISAE